MANTKKKSAAETASQDQAASTSVDETGEVVAIRPVVFLPPLMPRRGLFLAMSVLLAIWLGFMLYLHFSTAVPAPDGR